MITVIARMKNQDVVNEKKKLQNEVKNALISTGVQEDVKAKTLYMNFRDMQHIFFTLQSKVLNTMQIPKKVQKQKKVKEKKEEKA